MNDWKKMWFYYFPNLEDWPGHVCFVIEATICEISDSGDVELPDDNSTKFHQVLRFLYTVADVTTFNFHDKATARDFVKLAGKLGVVGLKLHAESALVCILGKSNACEMLSFADSNTLPLLKEAAMQLCASEEAYSIMEETREDWQKRIKNSAELLSEIAP